MSVPSQKLAWTVFVFILTVAVLPAAAGNNTCEGDEAPDVIVGNLHQISRYGVVDDITGFSVGTVSCNIGDCWLDWFSGGSNLHPVIGQSVYRLKDGRMEQLGQGWLKHGFFALSQGFCFNDCQGTSGTHLGVHCSDPYSANLNGDQDNLGPKFEVNATTGFHPHPVTDLNLTGNAIFKRIQVRNDDLDPALNPGALYFVEGHYVTQDDSAAGNGNNNASHRKVTVTGTSTFNLSFDGVIQQQDPAIRAWKVWDTGVAETDVQVPNDGLYIVAAKATDLGGGMWNYEYAVHNLNSHRSAREFSVPIPDGANVSNVGFYDVDYHSGSPQLGTDWSVSIGTGAVTWSTVEWSGQFDQLANALRWGTMYNFRFDADVPPSVNDVTITLFRPGTPSSVNALTIAPNICDNSGSCDAGENSCNCEADCGAAPSPETECGDLVDNDCDLTLDCVDVDCCGDRNCFPDEDFDNHVGCLDCDDSEGSSWATPSETLNLLLGQEPGGTVLTWDEPEVLGGGAEYEVLRSVNPRNFTLATSCLADSDPEDTTLVDPDPPPIVMFAYLVRAANACPVGEGTLGTDTDGVVRAGLTCP
jgi:hypothetical protein